MNNRLSQSDSSNAALADWLDILNPASYRSTLAYPLIFKRIAKGLSLPWQESGNSAPWVDIVILQTANERFLVIGAAASASPDEDSHPIDPNPEPDKAVAGWHQAVQLALAAARGFLPHRAVCWRIALTEDGPRLLSGSVQWDPECLLPTDRVEIMALLEEAYKLCAEEQLLDDTDTNDSPLKSILRMTRIGTAMRAARFGKELLTRGRKAARASGRPLHVIAREQARLYRKHNIHRAEYHWYRLYDPALTWEDKIAYIGGRQAIRYWSRFNPEEFWNLLEYKTLFHPYAQAAGLPLPEVFGIFHKDRGQTASGQSFRKPSDIADWIESSRVREFVLKPVHSSQGCMILVLRRDESDPACVMRDLEGRAYTPEDIYAHMTDPSKLREAYPEPYPIRHDFLFMERLRQHEAITRMTGSETLCSVRTLTLRPRDGAPRVLAALFKLQPNDTGVDNTSQGAMAVPVDIETGALGEGIFMHLKGYRHSSRYRKHPDGGDTFFGAILPHWNDLLDLAQQAANAFPMVDAIGWDIAITDRGPAILEGNVRWGVASLQIAAGKGLATGLLKETYEWLCDKEKQGRQPRHDEPEG
jgi:Sugar-transfer associated ATP-grasp